MGQGGKNSFPGTQKVPDEPNRASRSTTQKATCALCGMQSISDEHGPGGQVEKKNPHNLVEFERLGT